METILLIEDCSMECLAIPLNMRICKGERTCIVTSGDHETRELMKLMAGETYPLSGTVRISGHDPSTLTRQQLLDLRKSFGIVQSSGGLISNLKLWENITLPLMFRNSELPKEAGEKALNYIEKFGYKGSLMALPGYLSLFEQRMASFIRSAILDPQIMIYAGCLDNLPDDELLTFLDADSCLRSGNPDMASLYITSDTDLPQNLPADSILNLRHDSGRYRRPV